MEQEFWERASDACTEANEISVTIENAVEQLNLKNQAAVKEEIIRKFKLIYRMLSVLVAEMRRKKIATAAQTARLQLEVNAINKYKMEIEAEFSSAVKSPIALELRKKEIEKRCNHIRHIILSIMSAIEKQVGLE